MEYWIAVSTVTLAFLAILFVGRRMASQKEKSDYEDVSEREWVEYEFSTIQYDYQLHPDAAKRIQGLFDRLAGPVKPVQ